MNELAMTKNQISDPETWVDKYGDILYRMALGRLRHPDAAQNIVQETFLAALKAKDRFQGNSTEQTWLIGILKHKITDHFRTLYREQPVSAFTDDDQSADDFFDSQGHWKKMPGSWCPDPGKVAENKEFWVTLRSCLGALSKPQADAFALKMIEGMESDEICKVLNVSKTNLWVMLHRARMQLRQCLETNWFQK